MKSEVGGEERLEHGQPIEALVYAAAAQTGLSGICNMLKSVAKSLDAYGCFLWQASDDSDLDGSPPNGSLFVMAHWFEDGRSWAFDGIELKSVVGQVAVTRKRRNVPRVEEEPAVSEKFIWWVRQNKIRCFCAVPVSFVDGPRGTLAVYRKTDRAFTEKTVLIAQRLAGVLPGLYHAVRDKISFGLVSTIERLTGPESEIAEDPNLAIQQVCKSIGETFNAHETSIYLADPLSQAGEYKLQATTWPFKTPPLPPSYHVGGIGITPWVLEHAVPVRIFNLGACESGRAVDDVKYPGMIWRDPLSLVETMMSALKVDHLDELPPLSYMIAPVMQGKKVLGAIRCCSMLAPPFIFASRDVALLKVAAALMGSYWSTRTEIRVWRNFVTRLRGLNEAAEEELAKLAPEQGQIRRACQAVGQEFSGPKDEILGEMHRLVEQQEHLYLSLAENIGGRIAAQAELQTNMQAQKSTYEDLFHQIKSPIHSAIETIRATLEGSASRDAYRSGLEALRSQIRRANRISRAVGIFGELSAGNEITANRGTRLQAAGFHKAVTELGEDYERMQETYRKIRFVVEPKGFDVLRNHEVWVDEDLLFHALANVLDNAGKYSYAEAKVRVFAGLTGGQRFHVSVANRGIRIRQSELPHLIERRFRGEDAVSVTGEGSGIGLWLVQKIMDAHSGELIIVPANQPGDTEFKLLFPATKAPPPQDNYADSHR